MLDLGLERGHACIDLVHPVTANDDVEAGVSQIRPQIRLGFRELTK